MSEPNSEQLNFSGKGEQLPKQWVVCSLGDLLIRLSNGANVAQYKEKVGFPITRIETISNETVDESRVKYILESSEEFIKKYSIDYRDILLSHINSDLHLGKTAIYKGKPQVLIHGMNLLLLRSSKYIYSDYLNYQLKYLRFSGVFIKIAQRAVNQSSINQSKLKNIQIRVCPLSEQHRIVEKIEELFSDIDKGIENLKTTQQQLKVYRQAVLKWAFEGKLTAKWREEKKQQGELKSVEDLLVHIKAEREKRDRTQLQEWNETVKTWEANGKQGKKPGKLKKTKELLPLKKAELSELPELLEGWCWAKVGNLAYRVTVGHVGSMKSEYLKQGIPFLRSQNVRENRFDALGLTYISRAFHESLEKSKLQPGDIVIVRSGNVGTACVIPDGLEEANCSDLVIIKRTNLINSKFISYYFNSVIKTRVNDKKVGVALTHFNTQSVEEFAIPFPTLEEQQQIVQEIEFRLSICDRLEATITENLQRAEALRQSILKQAFEGKLVPQDPNDEPAQQLIERIRQEKRQQTNGKQLELEVFVDVENK